MKKSTILMIVMLVLVPLLLVACGMSDEAKDHAAIMAEIEKHTPRRSVPFWAVALLMAISVGIDFVYGVVAGFILNVARFHKKLPLKAYLEVGGANVIICAITALIIHWLCYPHPGTFTKYLEIFLYYILFPWSSAYGILEDK